MEGEPKQQTLGCKIFPVTAWLNQIITIISNRELVNPYYCHLVRSAPSQEPN